MNAEETSSVGNRSAQEKITAYWYMHAGAYDASVQGQLHMGRAKEAWGHIWRGALPPPPADLLDVGTGTGQVALLLAELGYRVTGTDLAEGMLDLARAKSATLASPPTLLPGDAVDPAFPAESFDAITSRYLLWTLREPTLALANWYRLLRPGGTIVAIDSTWHSAGIHNNPDAARNPDRSEFRRLYDESVVELLPLAEAQSIEAMVGVVEAAGFRDIQVTPLHEMEQFQREHLPEGTDVRLQYRVSARKE